MEAVELLQASCVDPNLTTPIGMLPQPQRSVNGYRLYTPHDVEHLRFILKTKAIGFTLEEIREIVLLQRNGEQPCGHVEVLIEEKIAAIDAQLRALTDVRAELVALQGEAQYRKTAHACICGIIEQHGM